MKFRPTRHVYMDSKARSDEGKSVDVIQVTKKSFEKKKLKFTRSGDTVQGSPEGKSADAEPDCQRLGAVDPCCQREHVKRFRSRRLSCTTLVRRLVSDLKLTINEAEVDSAMFKFFILASAS